jgi:HEAT repeat protein/thiol-disulfide isomerase/thioredoxin
MNWKRPIKFIGCLLPALLAACLPGWATSESGVVAPVFHPTFQAAEEAAAADQSLVLLIFSAQWCGPCKMLKANTLASPAFMDQTAPLQVADVDTDENQKLARDFDIEVLPTLVLVTPDGKVVSRRTGFVEAGELTAWLESGRAHAAAGLWEGTVPGAQFNEFIKRAAADELGTNDIQQLVDWLDDPDPANREQAGKILLAQREKVVPPLIEAVGHPYLGERIGASELLQRLAPDLTPIDPWQSPVEMSNTVAALRKWWAATGTLPAAVAVPTNRLAANSVKEALEQLRGDDATRRTAAMTALVHSGAEVLPAVREAIKHAERTGDQRTLGLLEDVRWTLLVPDSVEQQSGGVRGPLARGKSSERQAAAERLGGSGRNALEVLKELAGDPDPLVVESAIRALSGLNASNSIPALATLLNSPDSNLRMTAAQALGHTRDSAAIKSLLPATADTDEVVACAALAALEENLSRDSDDRPHQEPPVEITDGLRRCLADPRWRVRACAAEIAGKLNAAKLTDDLRKLLDDSDGFVVKSTLAALDKLNARPEPNQLLALSKRLPSLQGDTVEMLLQSESDETVKTVTKLFESGNPETRLAILGAFLRRGFYGYESADEGWKPMLSTAIAAPDARLRRVAVEVLGRRTPAVAAELVSPLLADEDSRTRQLAAGVVLQILGRDKNDSAGRWRAGFSAGGQNTTTNKPAVTTAQKAAWHTMMLRRLEPVPDLNTAAALFVTGDGKTDLPNLLAALNQTNGTADLNPLRENEELTAIQAIMPRLSLPDGRPVLDAITASPVRFAQAVARAKRCQPAVADYLLDPVRFKTCVETAAGPALMGILELVAGSDYAYDEDRGWSLWSETPQTKAVAQALLDSTNAAWRAAGVFSLGLRSDAKQYQAVFEKAVSDPNPWVRGAAVRALARNLTDRSTLEPALSPLLADTNQTVAAAAAIALLEPETRGAAGWDSELELFQFESARGGRPESRSQADERPLAVLEGKPAFLSSAQKWLAVASDKDSTVFVLLLAQYGDFGGLDRLLSRTAIGDPSSDEAAADPVLAAIALSHDSKYLPKLKQMAAARNQEPVLRQILRAMKGMSGSEARQLRLEINKKIRNTGGGSSGMPE